MSSTFFGIEIAKRSLQTQKIAMDVAGNNVANASTTGYSRQRVNMVSNIPYQVSGSSNGVLQLGTGVTVENVQRLKDEYIDRQSRSNLGQLGYWEQDQQTLQRVEAIFPNSDNGALQTAMDDFFNGWQSINEYPLDSSLRTSVLEKGKSLADTLNQDYQQLSVIGENLDEQLNSTKEQISQLCDQIISVSDAIDHSYAKDNNVLLDKRDLLLDNLAKLVKIDVRQNDDNKNLVDVTVGGVSLISGTSNDSASFFENTVDVDGFEGASIGGTIGGILDARTQVGNYMSDLKTLAGSIAKAINDVYTSNGVDALFFKSQEDIDPDSNYIIELAVTTGDDIKVGLQEGASGDTTIALAIAQLRNQNFEELGNSSFEAYNQQLMVTIGEESSSAQQMQDNYQAINDQLYALQQSVSGVSIDEEMTNILEYQTGYQAAAKVMTSINDMLDILMNIIR